MLGGRISSIIMAVAAALQGKSQDEISDEFKKNLDRLAQSVLTEYRYLSAKPHHVCTGISPKFASLSKL